MNLSTTFFYSTFLYVFYFFIKDAFLTFFILGINVFTSMVYATCFFIKFVSWARSPRNEKSEAKTQPPCDAALKGLSEFELEIERIGSRFHSFGAETWAARNCYNHLKSYNNTPCNNDSTAAPIGDRRKWYWTKWYGQNGSNFYRLQFNWIEFLFSNPKSQISDKPKWV